MTLQILLAISAILFAFGLAATLSRSNAIMILIGIELMLGAANLNFVAFWRFSENPAAMTGVLFAIFSIAVAAAEAAVGLAIIILVHRRIKSVEADDASNLKG
ncbi:MAG: NADH-quinone oxidoreductase subunit NuoK [Verrucomicrobia bacterium]|nr:NADH-quinone oxidoreductase subunit NuoK [Verrucomicrobiota bacterium]